MSDFNQWRFKMHSTKSLIPPPVEVDEKPRFNENIFASSSASGASSTLPRRKPRPKLMSYFGGHSHQSAEPEHFLLDRRPALSQAAGISTTTVGTASDTSKEITATAETLPDVDLSITALMSRLLSDPGKGLSLQDTSLVLRIIESYRDLGDKVASLKEKLVIEKEKTKTAAEELQQLEVIRASDEKDFRAEIKRLEMVIAEGKRGMSDLLIARQGSLIRRPGYSRQASLEDGFDGEREAEIPRSHLAEIEKPIHHLHNSPTRIIRLLPQSPSWKMADLSKQFSTSNMQHENSFRMHSREYESYAEPIHRSDFLYKDMNAQQFTDAENSSVSSCGDPLPDELQRTTDAEKSMAYEEETTIWQMADMLASRKGMDAADMMPALMKLFQDQPSSYFNVPNRALVSDQGPSISCDPSAYSKVATEKKYRGRPNIDCQENYDSVGFEEVSPKTNERRFSFCPNDDDAIKLRESWNRRKFATERDNGERPPSSSRGITFASPKLRNSESCPNCSPQTLLPISQLSRSSGNQSLTQIRDTSPNEVPIVMPIATTPDKERSNVMRLDSRLLDVRKDKNIKRTCDGDLHTKSHPSARFPSSGSQHSIVTAIWQDTNPGNNNHRTDGSHHHCQHARCDSMRSSLSHESHAHGQSLAMASLDITERKNLSEHADLD